MRELLFDITEELRNISKNDTFCTLHFLQTLSLLLKYSIK